MAGGWWPAAEGDSSVDDGPVSGVGRLKAVCCKLEGENAAQRRVTPRNNQLDDNEKGWSCGRGRKRVRGGWEGIQGGGALARVREDDLSPKRP